MGDTVSGSKDSSGRLGGVLIDGAERGWAASGLARTEARLRRARNKRGSQEMSCSSTRTVVSVVAGALLAISTAGCGASVQPTGLERPTGGASPSASQLSQSRAPAVAATLRPTGKGSAATQSCANLTFAGDFRRLFAQEAKFAPPKEQRVAGHGNAEGYEVTCEISPGGGQESALGYARFQYISDSKDACDKAGLKSDPADPAGGYTNNDTEWHYTLCTKLGSLEVLYRQGKDGRPTNLAAMSRLAHTIVAGSWEIDAVLGP